ncbi:MAG: Gfo/Idh/MocA family oxidoreductase [Alphaproteobacteria bacterium]|nr:Gfo/Idh/MocA family oxidoreductase [Alphaproteobacteria bacterium]
MNLHAMLRAREADGNPVRVGLIGSGKFGTMYLSQAARTPGIQVMAIADLDPDRAREACARVGGLDPSAPTFDDASKNGTTHLSDDSMALVAADGIDVVIDATGSPAAGIAHALACCEHGKHIVMVNVEADVLAGPLLAERARQAGVVYSLAYGDQPALIHEQVDWARACGLDVIAAGKGTKYLDGYHYVTPNDVWEHYGLTPEQAAAGGMNPQMFNSFLDGTKSAIEMAAVANASGLTPAPTGLAFPPCGVHDLPHVMRPRAEGGSLHHKGQVEVISSEERDGRHVTGDLRWGVYVVFEAPSDYVRACFDEYGLVTDSSGSYSALWKPYHLIGLELGISVANVALRAEATGAPTGFRGDAVATAKRDLKPGEELDGEGGYTVYGRLMPGADSLAAGGLPIGLAHGVTLRNAVAKDQPVRWADVEIDETSQAVRIRREMEAMFSDAAEQAAQ